MKRVIKASIQLADLNRAQLAQVDEIAERYNVSSPVSGSWETEIYHEMFAIQRELNVTLDDAKSIMIHYLGFDESDFA